MRDIEMSRVNATREEMFETVKSPTLTHEQKLTTMTNLADSLLEVLKLPKGLDELLNQRLISSVSATLRKVMLPYVPDILFRIMPSL